MRGGSHRHEGLPGEDERLGRAFDRRLMRRLLRWALPYRRGMALVVVLILAVTALELVGPFVVKWAIDGPLRSAIAGAPVSAAASPGVEPAVSGPAADPFRSLAVAVGIYLAAAVGLLFLRNAQGISMATIGQRVMRDLRLELFRHLGRLPVSYFDRNPVGRLTTRVTNDVEALNGLFSSGVVTFVADILVLACITAALLWVNVPLALTLLCVLPPLIGVTVLFRRFAQRFYRQTRSHLAHLNGFTQESIQGMSVIQLFTRERENARRFREINERYLDAFQRTVFCYSLYFPAVEVIAAGALAAILLRGGVGLRAGTVTFGEFYLFWHFLSRFMSPVRDMAERYNVLQSAMAAAERVFKVLDTPVESPAAAIPDGVPVPALPSHGPDAFALDPAPPPAVPAPVPLPPRFRGEVEFRDVWFAYERRDDGEQRYAVRGVSFTVRPGETVAIVGATGAGKSTLAGLLGRFYRPGRGSIWVDGHDIASYPLAEYRMRIGVVLQDPFLFSRSVRENIRLGRDEVDEGRVLAAVRRVNAERFVSRLRGGLDAVLGERGAGLSAGEKQLLSFARALAHDPDILVLDEATASIDPATEALIQAAVRELLAGRTSIVIAHRLSTVRAADRIVVLHKGEVREVGTHRELLALGGIYSRLHRLGLGGDGEYGPGPGGRPPEEKADESFQRC